jgi:hypothetical protein
VIDWLEVRLRFSSPGEGQLEDSLIAKGYIIAGVIAKK